MKNIAKAFLALSCLAFLTPLSPAWAEDGDYYIELGGDVSKQDAQKEWDALTAKHKKLLAGLKFYPKTVIQAGASVATRIQAGPIADKTKAEKICARLFTDETPCFVIEGIGEAPPSSVMNLSEKAEEERVVRIPAAPEVYAYSPLPWLEPEKPAKELSFVDRILGPLDEPQVVVEAAPELKEAPRQPELQQAKETPVVLPKLESIAQVAAAPALAPTAAPVANAGWLIVEAFADEDSASAFWQQVRAAVPQKAAGLRVRILRPLMGENRPVTSLNIGPFPSRNEAFSFCRDGIQAMDKRLLCRFGSDEPAGNALPTVVK